MRQLTLNKCIYLPCKTNNGQNLTDNLCSGCRTEAEIPLEKPLPAAASSDLVVHPVGVARWMDHLPHHFYICISFTSLHFPVKRHESPPVFCWSQVKFSACPDKKRVEYAIYMRLHMDLFIRIGIGQERKTTSANEPIFFFHYTIPYNSHSSSNSDEVENIKSRVKEN